jgi:F-type H+-transporting ATPase subunit gamma
VASSGELRRLERRIRSVKSTQQITRAMEMIAASRINRAVRRVQENVPYAEMIHDIIRGLAATTEALRHPLLGPHEDVQTVAVAVNTSDRGLAGAYNANVFRRAEALIERERREGHEVRLYVTGRKGHAYFRFRGWDFVATWEGFTEMPTIEDAKPIAETLMNDYSEGAVDRVWVVYTDFQSQLVQRPAAMRILPVDPEEFAGGEELPAEFVYEPSPEDILDRLIPRFVEAVVFASLLESAASEHAMRQRAMASASENAEELAEQLTRDLNRARQAQITQEIAEIVGGAEALSAARAPATTA